MKTEVAVVIGAGLLASRIEEATAKIGLEGARLPEGPPKMTGR